MYGWKVMLGAVAVLAFSAGGAVHAAPKPGETKANLEKAMRGEAFAYAQYSVYAKEADRAGHRDVAELFRKIAREELRDHFTREARQLRFVRGNPANLRTGMSGEARDLVDYARWAKEAAADGCHAAARLFTEVRKDESEHLARYTAALKALTHPASRAAVPSPTRLEPAAVRPGPAKCGARTVRNLKSAMAGESFAHAKYTLYGDHARATGQPRVAALFKGAAAVELKDHFTAEAGLAGLIGDTRANLRTVIAAETEAVKMYGSYAEAADRKGDRQVAGLFRDIQGDEKRHRVAFRAALAKLRPAGTV